MVKRILGMALISFMVFALGTASAEMTDEEYYDELQELKNKIVSLKQNHVAKQNNCRKAYMEDLQKLGNTSKDGEKRKELFRDCRDKLTAMKEEYNRKRTGILDEEKDLNEERKEARKAAKEAKPSSKPKGEAESKKN